MTDLEKKFAQLRQAHENGLLDVETYQASVRALEQQGHRLAHVQGSGSVAQGDHATAVGAGGVAVGGDLTIQGNVYQGLPPKDSSQVLSIYCRVLREQGRHFLLRGLDTQSSDSTAREQQPLQLDHVYVNLHTTFREVRDGEKRGESQPLTAL